jgi:tetratricopeptide (TPR) repeat protein
MANTPTSIPTDAVQAKPSQSPWLRWHPARLLYVFVVTLLVGIVYGEVHALLTNSSSALDPTQLRQTLFWQAAAAYPVYFTATCVLAVGAAVLSWRLDRRCATLQEEPRHRKTVAVAEQVMQRAQSGGQLVGKTIPHDLPPRAPGFVGRDADLSEIGAAVRRGQVVAIIGMGGIGKSSLASEAMYALAGEPGAFAGGVTWVRCDERTGLEGTTWIEDQLLAAWGAALLAEATARAATPEDGLALRERALRQRLGGTEGTSGANGADISSGQAQAGAKLVLLDNVEPGLPLARLLDLLQPLGIATLITTRVEPASQRVRLLRLEVLDPDAAVRLFAARYADRGGWWDAARDMVATTAIVDALGELPLAIELAAARAARTRLSLPALAQELRAPDAIARLSDPVDPSSCVRYSLGKTLLALSASQRLRFAALGLPEGAEWALPIIVRLFEGVPANQDGVAPTQGDVEALVAYSLVGLTEAQATAGTGAPRLRLHPLVRELAHEEWTPLPAPAQAAALAALLAGVRDWVEAHQFQDDRLYRALVPDEDLIAGALRQAAARQTEQAEVNRIVEAWGRYLLMSDQRLTYEMRTLQVASARAIGDRPAELSAIYGLIRIAGFSGREDEAAQLRRRALVLARELGDQVGVLRMLGALGEEAAAHGRHSEAEHVYAEAEVIAGQMGERLTDFEALNNLGNAARALGRPDEARRWYQRALASAHAAGAFLQEFLTEGNLAFLAYERGDTGAMRRLVETYIPFARATGNGHTIGIVVNAHGQLTLREGDLESAASDFSEALFLFEQSGVAPMAAHVRANQRLLAGLQALRQGDRGVAEQAFEQALRQFEAIGYLPDTPDQRSFVRQLLAELRE